MSVAVDADRRVGLNIETSESWAGSGTAASGGIVSIAVLIESEVGP